MLEFLNYGINDFRINDFISMYMCGKFSQPVSNDYSTRLDIEKNVCKLFDFDGEINFSIKEGETF